MTPATIAPAVPRGTQAKPRSVAESARTRRALHKAAGQWVDAAGVKQSALARVLERSEGTLTRQKQGQRASATSRACEAVYAAAVEDAAPAERVGHVAGLIEATLKSVAMWSELERMTTEELRAELARVIREQETRANGACNDLDADALVGSADYARLRMAHHRQAGASERIMAICDLLEMRAD